MILSDLSIKRPVFAWMLMAGLLVFGAIGFSQIGKSQLPDVDFPVLTISVVWEGASPGVMETEVVDVVENAVTSVKGVKKVASVTRQGSAMVTLEFDLKTNIDVALQEVQSKLSQAQMMLPKDIDPPVIMKFNPDDQPFMWISLSGDRPQRELMTYVKDELKDKFTTLPGVGDVFLGGYVEPAIRVWLDPVRMKEREITVEDVLGALRSEHAERPAGTLSTEQKEWNLRVMGEAQSVSELENMIIGDRSGRPIYTTFRLKDVATIEDNLSDPRGISRVGGKPAIGLGILKQRNANAVAVGKSVAKRVEELQKTLPQGMKLVVNFDGTMFIEQSTHELNFNLVLAAVLTSLICWLFLGSWSSAVNVFLAIPTSILGTFLVLYFLGYTQNAFTLLGLTLVIGIVVDDAIMVLENIVRHREAGEPQVKAAIMGSREIYFAAMAASVAILAIFVPVLFVKGVIGKYFLQFGITISAAVLISLLEALTLAPMRCSQFLEVGAHRGPSKLVDDAMLRAAALYRAMLGWCLKRRWRVLLAATALFAASLSLFGVVRKELMPAQDQSMLLIQLETPVGSSLEFTDAAFKRAEAHITGHAEVDRYYSAVGGFEGGEINSGMIFVTLKSPEDRPVPAGRRKAFTQQELQDELRKELSTLPGLSKVIILDLSTGGGGAEPGFPVDFTIQGRDWEQLARLSGEFQEEMRKTGVMVDVNSNYKLGMPEVQIWPDRAEAARRGVSVSSIANAVNASLGGVRAGKFSRDGHRYDIRVRFKPSDRTGKGDIEKIHVRNNRGQVVPLSSLVTIKEKNTLLTITRQNRSRAIRVQANVASGRSQAEAIAAVEAAAERILPEGVNLSFSGGAETYKEAFMGLVIALVLGVFVAYMVLGAQFNSFIHPVLVLLALPFSVTGAVLALVIGQQSLNMFSMIGIVLLMGIVKKNSILLVDFTNEQRKRGLSVDEALAHACPVRLRPILMTSAATIAAAIPPALALGPGAETRVPMALVIIGGVSVSTLLTLFVVPCAYSLAARLESHRHDALLRDALRELGEVPE